MFYIMNYNAWGCKPDSAAVNENNTASVAAKDLLYVQFH